MQLNIISISGGLGNQLFQYAYYLNIKNKNKFTFFWIAPNHTHNGFELDCVFGIKQSSFWNLILKSIKYSSKYLGVKNEDYPWSNHSLNQSNKFLIYYSGYWQSEKYFDSILHLIRKTYQFKEDKINNKSKSILQKINFGISVSLHVRRGDYLTDKRANDTLGNICTIEYYTKAIELIKKTTSTSISFYIFSDDIAWAKNTFASNNFQYIDWNVGDESWIDMYLMSQCKHNIIANSTFSWWGAWLNKNPDKIVIGPSKWFHDHDAVDIIPKDWIRI